MKVYIAALYSTNDNAAAEAVRQLVEAGHESTAQWINGAEETRTQAEAAVMDLEDVDRADALILLALPIGTLYKGGGRHFEMGYAVARGKKVIVVGDYETVFCHLPKVLVCPTVGAAINFLEVI